MSFVPSLRIVLYMAAGLAVLMTLVVAGIIIFMWPWLRSPPTYRFPLPPETALTEAIAVDLSKKALAAEGVATEGIRPIPCDDEGHYFAVNRNDRESGRIRWATPHGYYSVRVEREGRQIACRVYRLK